MSSVERAVVPLQWKRANILPIPKVPTPATNADFRPISITPVLTRTLEKLVVRTYIYPSLLDPTTMPLLLDQYTFRPTGSTTAALISIVFKITTLLQSHHFVIVIAFDFGI